MHSRSMFSKTGIFWISKKARCELRAHPHVHASVECARLRVSYQLPETAQPKRRYG